MQKRTMLTFILLLSLAFRAAAQEESVLPALYNQLCAAIDSIEIYDRNHLRHIEDIKERYTPPGTQLEKSLQLFQAYKKFSYDSASVYLNQCVREAAVLNDKRKQQEIHLLQTRYYTTAGLFVEAFHNIDRLDEDTLDEHLLAEYYDTKRFLYLEACSRIRNKDLSDQYWHTSWDYKWQLMQLLDSTSVHALFLKEQTACADNKYDEAVYYNERQLQLVHPDTPEYSWVTYFRSAIYRATGDTEKEKYWLILSAISDIRCAVKDQASLWRLAVILNDEGEERLSYRLMRATYDATVHFNSPLRYAQIVSFMTIMEHKYQQMTAQQNRQLRLYLWGLSIMAVLLSLSVIYIYRQMKRLAAARRQLRTANKELKQVNTQLQSTLSSLNASHEQLAESNTVKDVYIGRFLSLCSEYITRMEAFRQTILKKEKSGQLEEYLSTSRMREMKAKEVADFMNEFDKAFLHIVPSFIQDFNQLLRPECRITPTKGQTLNTELRIFALIRLGITDSSKIAEFLHFSPQTIYNYRSSVKAGAACPREEFETKVCEIGS